MYLPERTSCCICSMTFQISCWTRRTSLLYLLPFDASWIASYRLSSENIKDYDTGHGVQRYRCWDSCMYSDFTMMAHGNNRTSQMQRFRQRFMHKLVYFPANNDGMYSCVGCGRCVEKCPSSLNIVKVVKSMGGEQ